MPHLVNDASDQPQRVMLGHPLFEVHIGEQFTRPHIRTAHRFSCHPLVSVEIKFAIQCQRQPPFFSSLLKRQSESVCASGTHCLRLSAMILVECRAP